MTDRWTRLCRRLAPASLRESAFDPAVADLDCARARASGRRPAPAGRTRTAIAVLLVALECWRLEIVRRLHAAPGALRAFQSVSWLTIVARAARTLARQPLTSGIAVMTLALGIGANVAAFSYIDTFLLTRLPVPAADRLVRVYAVANADADISSYPDYIDLRDGVRPLDLAAHAVTPVLLTLGDATDVESAELVSGNFFRMLQLTPLIGRLVDVNDDGAEGAHPVTVLSEALWRTRFQDDPAVIGRTIRLNGRPYIVIGVVPGAFTGALGTRQADLWAPLAMQQQLRPRGLDLTVRGWGWLSMLGRLDPTFGPSQVRARLDGVAASLDRRFPSKGPRRAFALAPAVMLPPTQRRAILPYVALTGAFTLLLLVVTAANLAGMMQSRLVGRRREMAIRQSLGAVRLRLLGEWLAECLVLAAGGGLVGILIARATTSALAGIKMPGAAGGPLAVAPPFDWSIVGFAALLSIAAGLVFGLASFWRAAATSPASVLKSDLPTTTGSRQGTRVRRIAVGVQVAVSAVMLVAASLLVRSLLSMETLDPGFQTDRLAMVSFNLPAVGAKGSTSDAFVAALLGHVRALPGVAAADLTRSVPLMPGTDTLEFQIPGYVPVDGSANVNVDDSVVGAAYFETLGLRFVRGHVWDPAVEASHDQPTVAVINETMAKRFWAGRDPIGTSMTFVGSGPVIVVGIVHDSAYYEVGEAPRPFAYIPAESFRPNQFTLLVRTRVAVASMLPAISRVTNQIDPLIVAASASGFDDARHVTLAPERLLSEAATVFGGLALILTGVGLYGVMSTSVGQRTREIGVRMALGARASTVLGDVIREALALVGVGAGAGLIAGYALAGTIRAWLVGVAPFDVGLYALVSGLLALVAMLAAWAPARRASRVDPVVALRG